MISRLRLCATIAIAGAAMCLAPAAQADQSEVVLLQGCNSALCTGTGGTDGVTTFGQVTKTVNTAGTVITFDLVLDQNLQLINRGFGFNVSPSNLSLTLGNDIYENGSSTATGDVYTLYTGVQLDGFQNFSYVLETPFHGNKGGVTELKFTVGGSGLSLASVDQSNGTAMFAAEVGIIGSTSTGYIGDGTPSPVPEPTAIAFFGTGLLAAGFALRRKIKPNR